MGGRDRLVYWQIMRKSYTRNLQYRLSHIINNIGSCIFGFVSIAIWVGVLEGREASSPYNIEEMTYYMAFNQALLWVTVFLTTGLGIHINVRNGAISIELMRPVNYFLYVISHEAGRICYNFLFRSLPISIIFSVTVGFYIPKHPSTYLYAPVSILLAAYLGMLLYYLVGISSFWTNEIKWAHYTIFTLIVSFGGQMIPLDLLPTVLQDIAYALPFAGVIYTPTAIYLEKGSVGGIWLQVIWALLLTLSVLYITKLARKKVEIQGG
jgi:ABC-2 type transport system permease protein